MSEKNKQKLQENHYQHQQHTKQSFDNYISGLKEKKKKRMTHSEAVKWSRSQTELLSAKKISEQFSFSNTVGFGNSNPASIILKNGGIRTKKRRSSPLEEKEKKLKRREKRLKKKRKNSNIHNSINEQNNSPDNTTSNSSSRPMKKSKTTSKKKGENNNNNKKKEEQEQKEKEKKQEEEGEEDEDEDEKVKQVKIKQLEEDKQIREKKPLGVPRLLFYNTVTEMHKETYINGNDLKKKSKKKQKQKGDDTTTATAKKPTEPKTTTKNRSNTSTYSITAATTAAKKKEEEKNQNKEREKKVKIIDKRRTLLKKRVMHQSRPLLEPDINSSSSSIPKKSTNTNSLVISSKLSIKKPTDQSKSTESRTNIVAEYGYKRKKLSEYIKKFEPTVEKSLIEQHLNFCQFLENIVLTQPIERIELPRLPITQKPNETERFRSIYDIKPYREETQKLLRGIDLVVPDPPLLKRSYIKRFLRPANESNGERPCLSEERCISLRILLKFADQRKNPQRLIILREFLMPSVDNEFQLSGKLPKIRKFCFLCHIKHVTEILFTNMAHRSAIPEYAPESLQTYQVDPREYPANNFLPYTSPDSVPTGITKPMLQFLETNYQWVLDSEDQPKIEEVGMDFRPASMY